MGEAKKSGQFGTKNEALIGVTADQIANLCLRGKQIDVIAADAALAVVTELKPRDSTELLLATQMAAVHMMAMEMSRRAIYPEQTTDGVDKNINRVTKLMRTYTAQVEALNKYRTKGRQKITVQHVNVNDGGQAVIGDVKQGVGNG